MDQLSKDLVNVVGDVVISAGAIAYSGVCSCAIASFCPLMSMLAMYAQRLFSKNQSFLFNLIVCCLSLMLHITTFKPSGPFTPVYRANLLDEWTGYLKKVNVPHSEGANLIKTLQDPVKVSKQLALLVSLHKQHCTVCQSCFHTITRICVFL